MNNELPLVSIITATRNLIDAGRKDFFRQCVESVRMQDYPNIEHLIIDGASTDGSVALFEEMGLNYVSEADTGVYNAFNKGIKLAKGKYIVFLGSDDFYTCSDAISLSVNALEQNNTDCVYGLNHVKDRMLLQKPIEIRWNFMCIPFSHQTLMTSVSLLKEVGGFDEKYKYLSDYDLFLKVLLNGKKFFFINKSLLCFSIDGMTSLFNKESLIERASIIEKHFHLTRRQAVRAVQYGFLPKKTLSALLDKTTDFPNADRMFKYNRERFIKFIRRQIFTLNRRKGKRCFRLLGITFYNEVKL